jgi:hypothetical protein
VGNRASTKHARTAARGAGQKVPTNTGNGENGKLAELRAAVERGGMVTWRCVACRPLSRRRLRACVSALAGCAARVGGSASGLILGDMVDVLRAEVQVKRASWQGAVMTMHPKPVVVPTPSELLIFRQEDWGARIMRRRIWRCYRRWQDARRAYAKVHPRFRFGECARPTAV